AWSNVNSFPITSRKLSSNSFFCGIILGLATTILFPLLSINQCLELLYHKFPLFVQGACRLAARKVQFFRSFHCTFSRRHTTEELVSRRAHSAADEAVEIGVQDSRAIAVREQIVSRARKHTLHFSLLCSSYPPAVAHYFFQLRSSR